MIELDEQRLLQRLAYPATRHAAFQDLVKAYAQPLYWKVRRMVLVHEDADDLVQNVFLKAWNGLDNFKQQARLSSQAEKCHHVTIVCRPYFGPTAYGRRLL